MALEARVKHFLSDRCQWVTVNGEQSAPADVTSGLPQGTAGSSFVLCFTNDLPDNTISTGRLFYADDVILYRVIHSEEDCHHL